MKKALLVIVAFLLAGAGCAKSNTAALKERCAYYTVYDFTVKGWRWQTAAPGNHFPTRDESIKDCVTIYKSQNAE